MSVRSPVYWYEPQEAAMAPGIVAEWPETIAHPTDPNGRLVRRDGCPPKASQTSAGGEIPAFLRRQPRSDAISPANAQQVGGDHYKRHAIQPWDFIAMHGLGFFDGNALKYLSRWKRKGGIEDLRKARHYIDKLIELELERQEDT